MVLLETLLGAWGETVAPLKITEIKRYKTPSRITLNALKSALKRSLRHFKCFRFSLGYLEYWLSWDPANRRFCRDTTRTKNLGVERQND
jgi:hypothetical protein